MARGTWVFYDGELLTKSEVDHRKSMKRAGSRSDLPCPYIRTDHVEPFLSHIDGKTVFDSKSAWEKHVRAHGYTIAGNDLKEAPAQEVRAEATAEEIKEVAKDAALAFEMHEQGYQAPPLERTSDFALPTTPGDEFVRADVVGDKLN